MSYLMDSKPMIYIDTKKHRVRIHNSTIELLGSPDYVQLLVNPKTHAMLVKPCRREDPCSNHLHKMEGRCCELYSMGLIGNLAKTMGMVENAGYTFSGEYIAGRNAVMFDMSDYYQVTGMQV